MPSKWIRQIQKGDVGKRRSPREKTHRGDPESMSCNAGRPEYDMRPHTKFSTEQTKEEWPSSVQRVRLPRQVIRNHCCQRINR